MLGDEAFDAAVERVVVFRDQLTLEVRREHLPAVAQALRDDAALRFELCLRRVAVCTTPRTAAANCTPSTR